MKSAVILSAAIIATALVAMMGLYLYFSPYHSCVRVLQAADYAPADAALACLHGVEPDTDPAPDINRSRAWQPLPVPFAGGSGAFIRTPSPGFSRSRRARHVRTRTPAA